MPRQSLHRNNPGLLHPDKRLARQRQGKAYPQLGRLTALSLACAACFAPLIAHADCAAGGAITTAVSGTQIWASGNCSISSSGTISNSTPALLVSGNVGTLTNNGIIAGDGIGLQVATNGDSITSVINSGLISAVTTAAIENDGTIGTLNNRDTISAQVFGISNNGIIGTLDNSGTISSNLHTGLINAGTIGMLSNTGTISGSLVGIYNIGSVTILSNGSNGTISGGTGIYTDGTIGTLSNSGLISGSTNGIQNDASGNIGLLSNTGVITGGNNGLLNNSGTITSLVNSGTIRGASAIYNASGGTLGVITNSGLIAGNITNANSVGLTINGGSGTSFGTLTGSSGGIGSADMGTISNMLTNLSFNSGNLLLNDRILVGGNTITNSGATLQVNNNVTISGNYRQNAAATLAIGVSPGAGTIGSISDTGYGRLIVSGAAVIDAGSSVTLKPVSSFGFVAGQRFVVMQALTSGTNYNASSLTYAATGFSGTVDGTVVADGSNSDLLLTLVSSNGSSRPNVAATAPNAISAINGLFNYTGTNASLLNVFNASAALGSTAAANRAGAQLSPASNASAASQASSAPTQTVLNVASAHVDGLRVAQIDGGNGTGVSTGESGSNVAWWGQAFGGEATQNQRDNISGYHANYNGLLIGADTLLNPAWRVGGLFSYANTSVASSDDNSGSSVHVKSYGLIGYAGYTADHWYLDLTGGLVKHQYNSARVVDFTGFSGTANGNYNGRQYVLSAQAGYPIKLDSMMPGAVLTPIAGLYYSKLYQDGYTESGGSGAALTVQSNSDSSFKSDLGAKLERSFATSYGSLSPSVQLTWRHEYRNSQLRTVADFAADTTGTTSFATLGAKPISDMGVVALALTLTHTRNMTVTARYTVQAASGYSEQTADVRLRYQF